MLKLNLQYFGDWMRRTDSFEKTLMLGKIEGRRRKGRTEDEMVGWHHWLDGHGFGWTPGVGDGQGGLACCSSWGRKKPDTTEWLNWIDKCSPRNEPGGQTTRVSLDLHNRKKKQPINFWDWWPKPELTHHIGEWWLFISLETDLSPMTEEKARPSKKLPAAVLWVCTINLPPSFHQMGLCPFTKQMHLGRGFPHGLVGKESACSAGDTGDVGLIPGSGRSPGEGEWQPIPIFLSEKSYGQRSLAGYSSKGHKELDMTERLSTWERKVHRPWRLLDTALNLW